VGFCLNDVSDSEKNFLSYNGQNYSFPLAIGSWSAPGPLGEIVRIILEEVFEYRTTLQRRGSSQELLEHVLGCTLNPSNSTQASCADAAARQDPPTAWAALEVWSTAVAERRLMRWVFTATSMGYKTLPGLYTQSPTVELGRNNSVPLKWWESYLPGYGAHHFFTPVAELDAAIRGIASFGATFNAVVCPGGGCGQGTIRPQCDPRADSDRFVLLHKLNFVCDGGWWYSPACEDRRETCVPVVLGEFEWNVLEWLGTFRKTRLPVAVTWLGWFGEAEVVVQLSAMRFLFYWWEPDSTFLGMQPISPELVVFDERDLTISQVQAPVSVVWSGLAEAEPYVDTFFRVMSFAYADVWEMMAQQATGVDDETIACRWLKSPRNALKWRAWIPNRINDTVVVTEVVQYKPAGVGVVLGVLITVASLGLVALAALYLRRRRRLASDSPDNPATPTGQWVVTWVGAHRTLFKTVGSGPCWVINASPFVVTMEAEDQHTPAEPLTPWSFQRSPHFRAKTKLRLHVARAEIVSEEWEWLETEHDFIIRQEDWSQRPSDVESTGPDTVRYRGPVARLSLGINGGGFSMGQMKLTRRPEGSILIQWSVPHTLRGVTVLDLDRFFTRVIEHPCVWRKCEVIDEVGGTHVIDKHPRGDSRNMYDACKHIVIPEAAVFDWSYAELHTKCGPPTLFLSHVWAETANKTQEALHKLNTWISLKLRAHTSIQEGHDTSLKVWFCTLCNNQSRVVEELGCDVTLSPFAQVLRSESCAQVALISPFRALHRKWCNYEFCVSRIENIPVLMVMAEGVIQAGQVAPKTLHMLAEKVVGFNCRDATCTNYADECFIDAAVAKMGGYEELTARLHAVFRAAILEAHHCLNAAVTTLHGDPYENLRTVSGSLSSASARTESGEGRPSPRQRGPCRSHVSL